ncbi:MAG: group III truncated hemoglobin [Pyrinomonadaceae bacterium]
MKRDIQNREDIDLLMREFYAEAISDSLIGYIFTDVAKLDLDHHLPIIGDFWETMLFQTGDYGRHGRNPLKVHGDLNEKTPLLVEHFTRWLEIFERKVNALFQGERADFIKLRARSIGDRMFNYVSGVPPIESTARERKARP